MNAPDRIAEFVAALRDAFVDGSLIRLKCGGYHGAEAGLKSVEARKVSIKAGERLSFVFRYKTRDITKNLTLDEAQTAKKRHVAAKLLVEPSASVLDIGCGWGGLSLFLAETYGAQVTGITLSEEQHGYARQRAAIAPHGDQVNFQLCDYREVEGRFDRIVSVGMFEHVGVSHFGTFFRKCHDLLTDDGVLLLHSIGRCDRPGFTNPWIAKYIFPGGYIPSLSEVLPAVESSGLVVTDIEILRLHYAETLRHWRERFLARRDEAVDLYDERFARLWEFYLAVSEMAFRHQGMMVFQMQIAKRQASVPLRRDYIGAEEARLRNFTSDAEQRTSAI